MDSKTINESRKRARSPHDIAVEHVIPQTKKRSQSIAEQQINEPAIPRTSNIIRGKTQIYAPDTPISYTFHSCDRGLHQRGPSPHTH
jgi:hypothetical protein